MSQKADVYMRIARKAVQLGNDILQVGRRFPVSLAGLAGEYLAIGLLTKKGLKLHKKGAQAGYDLESEEGVRIEVRTSLLKDEGVFSKEKRILNYGWRLKDRNKEIKFHYVICVALNTKNVEDSKCYILTPEEVAEAPPIKIPRYPKVEKRLLIFQDLQTMNEARRDKPQYFHPWEENINRNKNKYLLSSRWEILLQKSS